MLELAECDLLKEDMFFDLNMMSKLNVYLRDETMIENAE